MACGGPRERRGQTVVFGPPVGARASGERTIGVLAVGLGVLGAVCVPILVPGVLGMGLAVVLGAIGIGVGFRRLRGTARRVVAHELAILDLAAKRDGVLTVTDVARALALPMEQADAELTKMADGARVIAEITSDGRVEFVFREIRMEAIRAGRGIRARVEEEVQAAAEARVEAELEEPAVAARREE